MKKVLMFITAIIIFTASISFGVSEDDFIGEYNGDIKMTTVNMDIIHQAVLDQADENGNFAFTDEEYASFLKNTLSMPLYSLKVEKINEEYQVSFFDESTANVIIENDNLSFDYYFETDEVGLHFDLKLDSASSKLSGNVKIIGTYIGAVSGEVHAVKSETNESIQTDTKSSDDENTENSIMGLAYDENGDSISDITDQDLANMYGEIDDLKNSGDDLTSTYNNESLDSSSDSLADNSSDISTDISNTDEFENTLDFNLTIEEDDLLNEISRDELDMISDLDFYYSIDDEINNDYGKGQEEIINKTQINLENTAEKNMNLTSTKTIDGTIKIELKDEDLSYADKKKIVKFETNIIDKVLGKTKLKYFSNITNSSFKNKIYTRDDKIKEIMEKYGMTKDEARAYLDANAYEEKEEAFSVVKSFVLDKAGFAGKMVQDQLDKLANAKKKALGKAGAREYRLFADAYVNARKDASNLNAIKAAYEKIRSNGEDALEKGEEYITFKDGASNFFKSPIKFISYKILNRDSKVKSYKERAAMYLSYLKYDKLYFKEGGTK